MIYLINTRKAFQPTGSTIHIDVPLTNFSISVLQSESAFVSQIIPNMPVSRQSDKYWIYDPVAHLTDEFKKRAPGTKSEGSGFTYSNDQYFCEKWSLHKMVTYEDLQNADQPLNLFQDAVRWLSHKALIRRERMFVETYFNSTNVDYLYTGGSVAGSDTFIYWDDAASNPMEDVKLMKRTMLKNTGLMPNTMIVGRNVHDRLTENDEVISRISGGATTGIPALAQRQLLAQLFEIDNYIVADSIYDSAVEGATTRNTDFILDDSVLLCRFQESGLQVPTYGMNFSYAGYDARLNNAGTYIKQFDLEEEEAIKVEMTMFFDMKVTASSLGALVEDIIQATY